MGVSNTVEGGKNMSLSIKSNSGTCTFEYKGENPELWTQNIKRVLSNTKLHTDKTPYFIVSLNEGFTTCLSRQGVNTLKDRVKLPEFYVKVERILMQIQKGKWNQIDKDFDRDQFKAGIKHLWAYATEARMLEFEQQVYETLLQNGNGGLSLDTVLERLWKQGILKSFSEVRRALEHLCTLYVVERCHGQFSPRYGMIEG